MKNNELLLERSKLPCKGWQPTLYEPGGTKSMITWEKLETLLQRVDWLHDDETITNVKITEHGITCTLEKK